MAIGDHDEGSRIPRSLARMSAPRDDAEYYFIELYMTADGGIEHTVMTQFAGWENVDKRWERRRARIVSASLMEALGEPYLVVEGLEQVMVFLARGGRALVERQTAEEWLPEFVDEHVAIPDGFAGFKSPALVPEAAFRRAPSPKLRMRVLKRDRRRCRVCGRSPDDSSDIQLRVHHVRPFGLGGLTEEKNLITLCHTCHDGLDPHFDLELFQYTDPYDPAKDREEFRSGVARYRSHVADTLAAERADAEGDRSPSRDPEESI